MANFKYRWCENQFRLGAINITSATISAALVMSNSTCNLDLGARTITGANGFGTLDEIAGGLGYSRQTMSAKALTEDATLNDFYFSANLLNFGTVSSSIPRQIKGALLFINLGTDATSIPFIWIDSVDSGPTFPFTVPGGGAVVRLTPNNLIWARFR